ncbi:MAG: extracellular solute-binding protein [Spirochaetales bacterium]|nr:extracellular solute-binding protein [Spirochaetales bacterium]
MRIARITIAAILCICSAALYSIDIFVNGNFVTSFTDRELETLDATSRGIWLPDLLPLVISCDAMTVTTTGPGAKAFHDRNLADRFQEGFLKRQSAGWELRFFGETVAGVVSIDLSADFLEQRDLEVWVSWEGVPELKEEIAAFARRHGCDIDVVEVPGIKTKLLAVLRADGRVPDLVMVQSDYLPELTAARALQPVDSPVTVAAGGLSGTGAFTLDDRLMASPFYFDSQVVVINPQIFPEGPELERAVSGEWDLNGFKRAGRAMKARGATPYCWNAYSAYWLVSFQHGFGKERLIEPDGRILMTDRPTVDAVNYLLDLQEEGLLEVNERDAMVTIFLRGDVGAILTGSYSIPSFEKLGIDFAVAPYPLNPDTGKPVAPVLDYKGFSITRKARNPVLARRLIQYLSSPGVQLRFTSALSKLPARQDVWDELERFHAYSTPLRLSAERGIPLPPDQAYGLFKNTMWKLLRLVLSGQMDTQDALEEGQAVVDGQLAARGGRNE